MLVEITAGGASDALSGLTAYGRTPTHLDHRSTVIRRTLSTLST
jgi:hypothetical protein